MNQRMENEPGTMPGEADATLRLIAGLPAPGGLEGRLKARVRQEAARRTGVLLEWRPGAGRSWVQGSWVQKSWVRGAAAAAIVAIVAGGSWGVYSRVQPKQAQIVIPRVAGAGGFASANAVRTPKTLDVPTVPASAKQKSAAGEKQRDGKASHAKKGNGASAGDGSR